MNGQPIDTKELADLEGFQFRAEMHQDEDTPAPEHSDDIYEDLSMADWEDHRRAWDKDDWTYVGVVVKCYRGGVELGSASIWGMEYGWSPLWEQKLITPFDDDMSLNGYRDDLIRDALNEAKKQIARITAGLNDLQWAQIAQYRMEM